MSAICHQGEGIRGSGSKRAGFAVVALLQANTWVDPSPHHAQFVPVTDGVKLEVLDFGGSGRPLVLLAGLGNTAHVFDGFAPKLAKIGHVYAITRRGYGASSKPESGYDIERLSADVLAVLDSLRLEAPVLIGHSRAGAEMSYLATHRRERISGLIYLEAAYRYAYDIPGAFEKDFPNLPPPASSPPAVVRQPFTVPDAERRQPPALATASKQIQASSHQFTEIGLPALAIFASPHDIGAAPDPAFDRFDEAQVERQARAFERGVPGARVLRWPRASHYLFLTREADVIREVVEFLDSLR
jgi:pimeloyl-ACP methyl ester carboxylesterase